MRVPSFTLLLLAACGAAPANQSDESPRAAAPTGGPGQPAANISVVRAGSACVPRWNGEALSVEGLRERGAAEVRWRLATLRTPTNVESADFPHVRLEAPADALWPCLEPTVTALRRAGFGGLLLRPSTGGERPDLRAPFLTYGPDFRPAVAVFEIEGRGRVRFNGRPSVSLEQLPETYVKAAMRDEVAGLWRNAVIMRPGASFSDLYDTLSVMEAAEAEGVLADCRDAVPPQGVQLRC